MAPPWVGHAIKLMEEQKVRTFTRRELTRLLHVNRHELTAPASLTVGRFIRSLESAGRLHTRFIHRLAGERVESATTTTRFRPSGELDSSVSLQTRGTPRYIWDEASTYEVALTMRTGSYLSHASAVFLHALTTQIPRTIYVNKEQTPKPAPGGTLSQAAIDRGFSANPRTSSYLFAYENTRIVLLSGKNTGNLETTDVADSNGVPLRVTKLERTLIDITVRPVYSGGIFEVLEAFRGAAERLSVPTLMATLKKLAFIYPYHQAIGFYMQRAGYPESSLQRLDRMPKQFDFYLGHKIINPQYDNRWRVYYPAGLE